MIDLKTEREPIPKFNTVQQNPDLPQVLGKAETCGKSGFAVNQGFGFWGPKFAKKGWKRPIILIGDIYDSLTIVSSNSIVSC